jgi:hypothetical protein
MVIGVLVGRKVSLVICLISVEVGNRSKLDVVGTDNAILRFLHFKFCLVVLRLSRGAFLESSELPLISRIQMENLTETLVGQQEGVEVASHNYLILRKVIFQSQQIALQVLDLHLVFFSVGTEMHANEDDVVGTSKCHTLGPSEVFLLLRVDLFRDFRKILEFSETVSVDENERILLGVGHNVLIRFLQLTQQKC